VPSLVSLPFHTRWSMMVDTTTIVVASAGRVEWYSTSGVFQSGIDQVIRGLAAGQLGNETVTAVVGESQVTIHRPGGQQTTVPGTFVGAACSGGLLWLLEYEDFEHFTSYRLHVVSDPSQVATEADAPFASLGHPEDGGGAYFWPIHSPGHCGIWMGDHMQRERHCRVSVWFFRVQALGSGLGMEPVDVGGDWSIAVSLQVFSRSLQ